MTIKISRKQFNIETNSSSLSRNNSVSSNNADNFGGWDYTKPTFDFVDSDFQKDPKNHFNSVKRDTRANFFGGQKVLKTKKLFADFKNISKLNYNQTK